MAKPVINIRASMLDQFQFYQWQENPFTGAEYTTEQFIEYMTGKKAANRKMLIGTAFHRCFEIGPEHFYNPENGLWEVEVEGEKFAFGEDVIQVGAGAYIPLWNSKAVFEQKHFALFEFENFSLRLYGTVDAILGDTLIETKTTSSDPGIERYRDSWQWRTYLYLFEARKSIYNIFKLSDTKTQGIKYKDFESFEFFRYQSLESELENHIKDLAFVISTNPILSDHFFNHYKPESYADITG